VRFGFGVYLREHDPIPDSSPFEVARSTTLTRDWDEAGTLLESFKGAPKD
jgi:hypothetical protein